MVEEEEFHSLSKLCIVFYFALVRAWLFTYVGIIDLHTFYDADNFFIHLNYNIFYNHTGEFSKTNKSNDLTTIPLEIMKDDLKNLHFLPMCSIECDANELKIDTKGNGVATKNT